MPHLPKATSQHGRQPQASRGRTATGARQRRPGGQESGRIPRLIVCRAMLWRPDGATPANPLHSPHIVASLARPWWQDTLNEADADDIEALIQSQLHRARDAEITNTRRSLGQTQQSVSATMPPVALAFNLREREILAGIACGLTNRAIAKELLIGETTVKWHIRHIFAKLGVHSRTQALAGARQLQLLM